MTMESEPHGMSTAKTLCLAASAICCWPVAEAAPQGGQVTSGVATIATHDHVTQIDQTTSKAAINWQGFDIARGETVDFKQPNASSITLNRVVGNERSVINGALHANGQVFLINSNGVLFSQGSSVNTAGFVASTLGLTDADFAAGRYNFSGDAGPGTVINQGNINANAGGYVALLGQSVSNTGVIVAQKGTISLAGGRKISLNFQGDSLLGVSVDEGALAALVDNKGAILADGGSVILTAKAANDLLSAQVNNDGVVQARTLNDLKGRIDIRAEGGTIQVGGVVDASAPEGGNGGHIESSGNHVRLARGASVSTSSAHGDIGTWSVKSDNFAIAASGGDVSGAQFGELLRQNNITLNAVHGDITVDDAVNWSASTQLAMNASHDIDINAPISATGNSAGLVVNYGDFAATGRVAAGTDYHVNNDGRAQVTLNGAQATLSINGAAYTLIHTMEQLAAISPVLRDANGNPAINADTGNFDFAPATGNYALANNLNADGTVYSHAVVGNLSGSFAGLGHSITNLTVSATAPTHREYENAALIGTFGANTSSALRDIRLVNASVSGGGTAAGLVATNNGSISNAYVSGRISGVNTVGGVVGFNSGTLDNSSADVMVSAMAGGTNVGGLAGINGLDGHITNVNVTGLITAAGVDLAGGGLQSSAGIGGLAGLNAGIIDDAHTNVVVVTRNSQIVGGLVGQNLNVAGDEHHAVINNSTSSGGVDATWTNMQLNGQSYGGLVGDNNGGFINGSLARVRVTATATAVDDYGTPWSINDVGALVGTNASSGNVGGTIVDSSAQGAVVTRGTVNYVDSQVGRNVDGSLVGAYTETR